MPYFTAGESQLESLFHRSDKSYACVILHACILSNCFVSMISIGTFYSHQSFELQS